MLAKCTNPPCSAEFRNLHGEKRFQLEIDSIVESCRFRKIGFY
jgi:hypothetical protein